MWTYFGKRVSKDVIKVMSCQSRVGPKSNGWWPRRHTGWDEDHVEKETEIVMIQLWYKEKPRMASYHQNLGRGKERLSLELWEVAWSSWHLISEFLPRKCVRINFVFHHPVHGTFLYRAWETNTNWFFNFCLYKIPWIYILISISSIDSNFIFMLSLKMIPPFLVFFKGHRGDKTGINRKPQ